MKINGSEYNPCQLNETTNLSPDGKVLSKSLMFNLRGETPEEVYKTYQELKRLIGGEENKPKKGDKKETPEGTKQNEKGQKKSETCPECKTPLVEKSGISNKNGKHYHFWGCSNFPICTYTRNIPDKETIPVADQDLITIEER